MHAFTIWFDRSGLLGIHPPPTNDAAELAGHYAFLRRIAVATHDFNERIKTIESAYEVVAEQTNE